MDIDKIIILKTLYYDRPTIAELAEVIVKSEGTVYNLLQELVAAKMVFPPRTKKAARDYKISDNGIKYLQTNKYI